MAAAEELLVERSYSEVSMNEIAEAAGVTKGALYHHFDSKEELYLAMMRRDLLRKKALFTHAIDAGGTCRERLRNLTRAFFSLPVKTRDLIKLVRRDISFFAEPARSELIHMYQSSLPKIIEPVMAQGIRDRELALADPRLLSWFFVAQVEIMLGKYADSVFPDEDTKIDFALDLFFTGAKTKQPGASA
jgi:AcrR family transcriptional regulator